MKLFEYMASGTPIIASDLPSIREILNEQNSILVDVNDSKSFAKSIEKALLDSVFSVKISQQALLDAKRYSWAMRVKNILNFTK